jgi:hypothetical protein
MPRTDDDIPLVAGVPLRLQIKKPRPTTKIARFYSTVNITERVYRRKPELIRPLR